MSGHQFVVLDIPLLFENKADSLCHKIIVVGSSEETQLDRLIHRNGYSLENAKNRINSQMPLEEKERKADYYLDNNASLAYLHKQLETVMIDLKNSNLHWLVRLKLFSVLAIVPAVLYLVIYRFKSSS